MDERNQMLHRVKIKIPKDTVKCPVRCDRAENCYRCNEYYKKCSEYKKWNK